MVSDEQLAYLSERLAYGLPLYDGDLDALQVNAMLCQVVRELQQRRAQTCETCGYDETIACNKRCELFDIWGGPDGCTSWKPKEASGE